MFVYYLYKQLRKKRFSDLTYLFFELFIFNKCLKQSYLLYEMYMPILQLKLAPVWAHVYLYNLSLLMKSIVGTYQLLQIKKCLKQSGKTLFRKKEERKTKKNGFSTVRITCD
jgi:hypothetical protein